METNSALATVPPTIEAETSAPLVHLIARSPQEMGACQANLALFLRGKVTDSEADVREIDAALDAAIQHKWGVSALRNQAAKARKRNLFYQKVLAAVEAGYTIIPNIPCDVFAVRVKRDTPSNRSWSESNWEGTAKNGVPNEKADTLPQGEGHYISPEQMVAITDVTTVTDDKGNKKSTYLAKATDFRDVEFPVAIAIPEIMEAAAHARALRVFDELAASPEGIVHRRKRYPDPIVVGRIILDNSGPSWQRKFVTLLIAWHLDLRTL